MSNVMPSHEQIATFLRDHSEPLVEVPQKKMSEFHAGKIAVLTVTPEAVSGDEPTWQRLGFADSEIQALRLLQSKIIGLAAVTKRPVFYFGSQIWPPILGSAFIPLLGP
jgi:hypothetical protein